MLPNNLKRDLEKRIEANSLRELSDQTYPIDFYSNDYLGYAQSKAITVIIGELSKHKTNMHGSTGSRLISGNHMGFQLAEEKASSLFEAESALFYNSGYDANIGLLSAVLKPKDLVFYDELCHASIRDGLQMCNAKTYKFKHCDYEHLEELIKRQRKRLDFDNLYVVTESVFSMDGDITDIEILVELKNKYNLHLIVDEAHAIGVCGSDFKGLTYDFSSEIFARIITCGKSLGSHGAFVFGSTDLKQFLVNFSRPLIYSTGSTPAHLQSVLAALLYFDKEQTSKLQLQEVIGYFRQQLDHLGLKPKFLASDTAIQSYIVADTTKAKALAEELNNRGIGIKAILHPTVPKGKERLRICLHSFNTEEEMDLLLKLCKN
jgi:8-amino-7-oxononanoate synthase